MWVCSKYRGDTDSVAMWEQHDVYVRALRVIVDGGVTHMIRAARLLGQSVPARWLMPTDLDHRTVQEAHDILAAAWRWQSDCRQLRLPFRDERLRPVPVPQAWLAWLRAEVERWVDEPAIVQSLMLVLAQQNTDAGYRGEQRLETLLKLRFCDVPWYQPGSWKDV